MRKTTTKSAAHTPDLEGFVQVNRKCLVQLLTDPALTDRHRRVFLALLTFVDPKGVCYPSLSAIASRSGVRPNHISTSTSILQDREFLTVTRRGKKLPNVYDLSVTTPKRGNHPGSDYPKSGQVTTPKRGNPSLNDNHLTITPENIYDHFAKRVKAGARKDAIDSIEKLLKDHSPQTLIACIDRYAGNGMSPDPQFRIQANNFFGRKARYMDYLTAPATGPAPGGRYKNLNNVDPCDL